MLIATVEAVARDEAVYRALLPEIARSMR